MAGWGLIALVDAGVGLLLVCALGALCPAAALVLWAASGLVSRARR